MQTVMIDSAPHDSYASLAQYNAYVAAAFHASTSALAASDDAKGRALVTMTRILDRQRWTDAYDTRAEREGVLAIREACIEGALALLDGADFQSEQTTGQKLQSITAGPVSMTYFRGAEGRPHRFPVVIYELLRDYLAGSALSLGMVATGTEGVSSTADDYGHTEGL